MVKKKGGRHGNTSPHPFNNSVKERDRVDSSGILYEKQAVCCNCGDIISKREVMADNTGWKCTTIGWLCGNCSALVRQGG